ncbi:DUF6647 family protein [Rhodospirillum centenum]|uniref:DUF6647 domain-containing protein n=1 Tax=Rhodospirillum centenum (strain ATCC 51521 / SW) TaxID=414684 RepID=B6IXY3_RHOCS|nr:DUF6647 family protein [Rhodospirillum centenum]ACJ01157.1 hypothetical protein RC1_3814 [Rhodospirillum centenum SW]
MVRKAWIQAVLAVLLAAAVPPVQGARAGEGRQVPPGVVAPLLDWVGRHTGRPGLVPPVVIASRQALLRLDRAAQLAGTDERLRAAYVPGVVILDSDTWSPADPVELSYLVHELVHHAQQLAGRGGDCRGRREEEAYRLQNLWLAERGLPPEHDPAWIARAADLC